jgi:hypothetical protein
MTFPLPLASQEHYTKWFKRKITTPGLKNYIIVWVGEPIKVRFKSERSADILPKNVFICKKNETFEYVLIDKNDDVYKLPKKFYTTCFPGIQYNNIPPSNKIRVQITQDITVELPFIPPSFLNQKKQKTNRKRRRIVSSLEDKSEQIDFDRTYPTWHVLQNSQVRNIPIKKEIMLLIRSIIKFSDRNENYVFKDPFANITNVEEIFRNSEYLNTMNIIINFIYNYCRSEMGIVNDSQIHSEAKTSEWILKLNSVD